MTKSHQYPLASFGRFVSDRLRTDAYYGALQQVITPESVVVNIGAGTGLFALFAARLGARRVIAVEVNPVIDMARRFARENGLDGRIEFVQSMSNEFTPDEPADVIISDLRGAVPLFEYHIPTIIDARRRLLAPGGVLLSCMDTIWAAPVSAPAYYRRNYEVPWTWNDYDLNLTGARDLVVNDWSRVYLRANQLVAEPQQAHMLDYVTVSEPGLKTTLNWTFDRATTLHGIALWFDATVHPGFTFSNRPGTPKHIYGQMFLPLARATRAAAGDRLAVALSATFYDGEYVWSWRTLLGDAGGRARLEYRQSTLLSQLTDLEQLRRQPNPSSS